MELIHLTGTTITENSSQGFIKELLEYHESMTLTLTEYVKPFIEKYGESGTTDFITGLMEEN